MPCKTVTSFSPNSSASGYSVILGAGSWKDSREMPWQKWLFQMFISPRSKYLNPSANGLACAGKGCCGFIWPQYDAQALLRDVSVAELRSLYKPASLPLLTLPQDFSTRACSVSTCSATTCFLPSLHVLWQLGANVFHSSQAHCLATSVQWCCSFPWPLCYLAVWPAFFLSSHTYQLPVSYYDTNQRHCRGSYLKFPGYTVSWWN